jgi:hypothetical protein
VRHPVSVLIALVLAVAACGPRTAASPQPDRNLITNDELQVRGFNDAFTAIQLLRPNWLRTRGPSSITGPGASLKVYVDGTLLGGADHLRQIQVRYISSIRYLDGLEATQRWGMDHGEGAIMISTRGTP